MIKEKEKKQNDNKEGGTSTIATLNQIDGEDLSAMDEDNSHCGPSMNGKHRFDQLIKTMIARIEYNNTLAPV